MFSDPNKRSTGPARALAAILVVALTVAAVVPPLALAESDQEGEGTAPPGTLPGLEAGEPEGPETTLEEVAPAAGEEEAEEVVPPVTVESEPPPAVVTEAPPTVESTPPPAAAPPQPEPAAPVYGAAEASPTYEPSSSSPSSAVVRNEAIVAPEEVGASGPERIERRRDARTPATAPTVESTAPPVVPAEAPEQSASSPPAPPVATVDRAGALRGHGTYTVAPGDCLWSIAAEVLPPGASNVDIAAEVARLWRINAGRIGTGNLNVILVGTALLVA
jgi:LysM repeat protein